MYFSVYVLWAVAFSYEISFLYFLYVVLVIKTGLDKMKKDTSIIMS